MIRRVSFFGLLLSGALLGGISCELIADVDRAKIGDECGAQKPCADGLICSLQNKCVKQGGSSSSTGDTGGNNTGGTGGSGGTGGTGGTGGMTSVGGSTSTGMTGMCLDPAKDCPGDPGDCKVWICDNAMMCALGNASDGTASSMQMAGDCQKNVCMSGTATAINDNTDVQDDGNACTDDMCDMGMPTHPSSAPDSTCNQNGGNVCDGAGKCVQCVMNADCTDASKPVCKSNVCVPATCGDGNVNAGEACDDGNMVNGDGCDNNCTVSACGNGITAGAEECDDGNKVNTDACTNACKNAKCGDNIVESGVEACDDGNMVSGDGCDNNCTATACGNGIVTAGEICDDGNMVNGDGCDMNCTPTGCGNGIITAGEECDDGNTINTDACTNACANAKCGDGIVEMGIEECDDGNMVDNDGCSNACKLPTCDGVKITGTAALEWAIVANGSVVSKGAGAACLSPISGQKVEFSYASGASPCAGQSASITVTTGGSACSNLQQGGPTSGACSLGCSVLTSDASLAGLAVPPHTYGGSAPPCVGQRGSWEVNCP